MKKILLKAIATIFIADFLLKIFFFVSSAGDIFIPFFVQTGWFRRNTKELSRPPWHEMKIPPSSPYYGYPKHLFWKSIMMRLRGKDTIYAVSDENQERKRGRVGGGRKTFIFIGDSVTWGCCGGKPFHKVFEEKMRERERRKISVRVFNFGVPGFNTRQEYFFLKRWFKHIRTTQGDAVVLGFLLAGDFVSERNFAPEEDTCFDEKTGLFLSCIFKIHLDKVREGTIGREQIESEFVKKMVKFSPIFSFMSYFGYGIPYLTPGITVLLSLSERYVRLVFSVYVSERQGRRKADIWNEVVPSDKIWGTSKWVEKIKHFAWENGLSMYAIIFPTKAQIVSFLNLYMDCVEKDEKDSNTCISEVLTIFRKKNPSSPYFVARRIFQELQIPYLDMFLHYVRYIISVSEQNGRKQPGRKIYQRVLNALFRDETHPSGKGHYIAGLAFFRFWLDLHSRSRVPTYTPTTSEFASLSRLRSSGLKK